MSVFTITLQPTEGGWSLIGPCLDDLLFPWGFLALFFAISKDSYSFHTRTCEKTLGFWQESFKLLTLVKEWWFLKCWNLKCFCAVLATVLQRAWGGVCHPPRPWWKPLFMGWQKSALGAGGQFPVVWLLEGNDANTNPGFSSWEIQEASPRSGGGRRMFVKVPVLPCPHINELSPLFLLDSEEYSSSTKPRSHWQAKATVFSNLPGSIMHSQK